MEKTYLIGRETNDLEFKTNDASVSRKHAQLTQINADQWLVEDLESTNGTFVNGVRILKTILFAKDILKVANVEINTAVLFKKEVVPVSKGSESERIKKEFVELKEVYDTFIQAKLSIQKKGALTSAGLRAGLSIIPYVGNAIAIMSSTKLDKTEKLMAIEEQLKIDYVCPKCKVWLGPMPWEALKNRKFCLTCKTNWLDPK